MFFFRKMLGLMLMSMGAGMLLVLFIPGWGFILATLLMALGYWIAFMC
jgi:hypothetical protein